MNMTEILKSAVERGASVFSGVKAPSAVSRCCSPRKSIVLPRVSRTA